MDMEYIMIESGLKSAVIDMCCENKAKDVIMHLFFCSCNNRHMSIRRVLNDAAVSKRIKGIYISSISDIKWILPLKLKCYPIIKYVYGLGS